jgi:hypothetical protein
VCADIVAAGKKQAKRKKKPPGAKKKSPNQPFSLVSLHDIFTGARSRCYRSNAAKVGEKMVENGGREGM